MLRIGCLGAAKITPVAMIEPARARADVELVAVASRSLSRAEAFAKENSIQNIETDYDALIRRYDVDAIYNALPPSRHCDLSIAALEAGKHVLCEKPLAMNAIEASRMADAAKASGCVLMEAFHYRFHPAFGQLIDLVESGSLGVVESYKGVFNVEIPQRDGELRHTLDVGGGALMDLGCYPVHWARTLFGDVGRIIRAQATQGGEGIDLAVKAELEFIGGLPAVIETSMARGAERTAWLECVGNEGRLVMLNPLAPHLGYRIELWLEGGSDAKILAQAPAGGPTTYDYQLAHFVALVSGQAKPILPPEDGVANMALIDGMYRAAGMTPRGL